MPWVTLDYAADLADAHKTTLLRQIGTGQVRARQVPSRKHEGKAVTEIELESLPLAARERWLLHRRPGATAPAAALPAAAAIGTIVHHNADAEKSGGLSTERLAWAQFRYKLIEPLLSDGWARTFASRAECVAATCAADHLAPNGCLKRYSASAIHRMLARFRDGGLAGLANDTRADRGTTRRLTGEMQAFVAAAYCSGGSPKAPWLRSLREVCRLVDEERERRARLYAEGALLDYVRGRQPIPHDQVQPPEHYLFPAASYGTIQRFIATIPRPTKALARQGEDVYKAKYEPVIIRDYAALKPMEWVVFDHRRCDIFVLYKKLGRLVLMRPWETVALDMRSRMVLASVLCEVPSALTVASCIRQIILRFGLFGHAYLDNGKEFTAEFIDGRGVREGDTYSQDFGGDDFLPARGIFEQLGIEVTHAAPYNARAKIIEPSFRNPAAFERTLAGACGNRPHHRPEFLAQWENEFRRWDPNSGSHNHPFHTYEQFRSFKDHFYFEDYAKRPHSGRGMNGRSPADVMRAEYLDMGLARMPDPRALDLLLQKRRLRTVSQGGSLVATFGGEDHVYSSPALFPLQGQRVETAHDPYQLGEMVVYEPGGDFICLASCPRLYGMGEKEIAEPIRERRRILRDMKQQLRDIQRYAAIPTTAERIEWSEGIAALDGQAPLAADPAPTVRLPERFERAARAIGAGGRAALPAADPADEIEFLGSV